MWMMTQISVCEAACGISRFLFLWSTICVQSSCCCLGGYRQLQFSPSPSAVPVLISWLKVLCNFQISGSSVLSSGKRSYITFDGNPLEICRYFFCWCFTSIDALRLSVCHFQRGRLRLFPAKDLLKKLELAQVLLVKTKFCFSFLIIQSLYKQVSAGENWAELFTFFFF